MKKIILISTILITSILSAESTLINQMNKDNNKILSKLNYENFDMEIIEHYTKIDHSNVYLKMVKEKLKEIKGD